ncbi:class I SAM-dependent methyltransferase [Schinkia sp. CFF1]
MRIPNFLSEEGSILYKSTVGNQISPKIAEIVIKKAGEFLDGRTSKVLDVACGPGTVSIELAKKYPEIQMTGIDSSSAMIKQCTELAAQEELQNTTFKTMKAEIIEFPEHSFDLVVCNLAFPFFSNSTETMRGMLNVLKPEGTILISVPGRNTWKEFFSIGEELFGDVPVFAKPFLSKFEKAELLPDAMEEAGFAELEITRHLIPFTFESGAEVLNFFQNLFELLNYVPDEIKTNVAGMIDARYPDGFTMHYEAVTVLGTCSK